nr:hypothetical protein [uncultured Acetatifactor sp.]
MERKEIYALARLGANSYRLRKLCLSHEEIQKIRQHEGTGYDGLRSMFEGIRLTEDALDGRMDFILPDSCGGLWVRTMDMGREFVQRNRHSWESMEGTREDMMAELRLGLQEQGYHFRPNACFRDVDVLEALQAIMEHNTSFCQTDFGYDRKMLLEAARDRDAPRDFLWMSRDGGTWCFPERSVHIHHTSQWNTWFFYGGCCSDHVKAFWVRLHGMEGSRVMGDIVETDYQKHLGFLCTRSHEPTGVEVAFKEPKDIRRFDYREYEQNRQSILARYGPVERTRYLVEDEGQLSRDMEEAHGMFWDAVEPMDIEGYVARLDHDRLHDYGYTAGDMVLTGPMDAERAIRQGLGCYILNEDGSRELARSQEDYQEALFHRKLFGMAAGEKEILRYLKQDAVPLFNKEEMWEIYSLALQAGMEDGAGESGLLDSIIHKAECFLPGAEEWEEDIQGEKALPGDVAR